MSSKKPLTFKIILITVTAILIVAAVFFIGRKAIDNNKASNTEVNDNLDADFSNTDISDEIFDSVSFGALYEENFLTYGPVYLMLNNYSLAEFSNEEQDYLMSADMGSVFYVKEETENTVPYEEYTEEYVLNSYAGEYTDVSVIEFEQLSYSNYPCIRYTVNADGKYIVNFILMNNTQGSKIISLTEECFTDVAYRNALDNFASLHACAQPLTAESTNVIGSGRITIK